MLRDRDDKLVSNSTVLPRGVETETPTDTVHRGNTDIVVLPDGTGWRFRMSAEQFDSDITNRFYACTVTRIANSS